MPVKRPGSSDGAGLTRPLLPSRDLDPPSIGGLATPLPAPSLPLDLEFDLQKVITIALFWRWTYKKLMSTRMTSQYSHDHFVLSISSKVYTHVEHRTRPGTKRKVENFMQGRKQLFIPVCFSAVMSAMPISVPVSALWNLSCLPDCDVIISLFSTLFGRRRCSPILVIPPLKLRFSSARQSLHHSRFF